MKQHHSGKVLRVEQDSIASELGIVPGDKIIEINGQSLSDIIDFSFACADEDIDLLVEHADGEQEFISFSKDVDDELGIEFESAVFDGIRRCANHCVFCFVDQVPPDMRGSLYVKDDDYRLSFLYGNFVTMTNMVKNDIERIKRYHLSPICISVHTTNMELRAKMLGTERASHLMEQLDVLDEAGIDYHAQVVLCPGINDGDELDKTIRDIADCRPHALSLAIVPVGLTKFREGCYPLTLYDKAGAERVIEQVSKWQCDERSRSGENFVYLGDEFYFMAGREIPAEDEYDGFPQLDNGVGLARNFECEWNDALFEDSDEASYDHPFKIAVICGTSIAPFFERLTSAINIHNLHIDVVPTANQFFGESVTVSGLLTGVDIVNVIRSRCADADGVIIPRCAIRDGENVFLDDMTLGELREKCGKDVKTALSGGEVYELLAHWETAESSDKMGEYAWQSNAAYVKY